MIESTDMAAADDPKIKYNTEMGASNKREKIHSNWKRGNEGEKNPKSCKAEQECVNNTIREIYTIKTISLQMNAGPGTTCKWKSVFNCCFFFIYVCIWSHKTFTEMLLLFRPIQMIYHAAGSVCQRSTHSHT